jgi:hypothetical protein
MADSTVDAPTEGTKRVGRPLKFADHFDLESAINDYFEECDAGREKEIVYKGEVVTITERIPYTVMGLCVALDCERQTLLEYGNGKYDDIDPQFSDTVKRAKRKVAAQVELLLVGGGQAAGPIFSLKNNFGWVDKAEMGLTSPDGSMSPKDAASANKSTVDKLVDMLKTQTAEAAG